MPEMTKIEPSIKNKKAIEVSKKMGKRYSLLDAMMMGRRLGIDWTKEKFTVGDLLVGMHYELEHGKVDPETNVTNDNPKKTAKVAWAHLKERPDYYVQLMKMDPPRKLEKKANEFLDEMLKLASKKQKKDEDDKESLEDKAVKGGAMAAGGIYAISKGRHALLGKKRVYHGTKKENYKSIMSTGVDPKYGGDKEKGSFNLYSKRGIASNERYEQLRKNSEGHVYVTTNRQAARAQGAPNDAKQWEIELGLKKGKVVKADLPYHKWKSGFVPDHDMLGTQHLENAGKNGNKFKNGIANARNNIIKQYAAKSTEKIPIEAIKGSDAKLKDRIKYTVKNLPESIKANPARFAAGAAAVAGGSYAAYKGMKMLSEAALKARKKRKEQAKKEKTAHTQLNEMLKTAVALNFSQQYTPQMNSGQFASEMKNKSSAFMSNVKAKKPTTSTDEYLGRAINNARTSTLEKATVVGSPEYKAVRNNENLKATINRKTEAALNKNRAEDSMKAFDKQFNRRKVKMGTPTQGEAPKVYSKTEGGAKAYLDKQVAAQNKEKLLSMGNKALIGAGIAAAGIGTYKALKKRKENKQRAAMPAYNYPQPYPQMMQHTAFSLLDNLCLEKTAEDEVVDFKEQIPDLILEAKYKPEIKKEETPGGKMTPSKYVQRKNKQRYNA